MAPLVPYIISNEFNLIIALIIGFGFGFILEQAGFSSTKKLVGLFYGYDFTVLRVFFTAGVTAMIGVIFFHYLGILDLSLIYVNPTFLRSSLVGGVVMGAGFIIGGFCPGTSICAASIGKMNGMLFIVGGLLGVFAFTESYPLIEKFYKADSMGPLTMFDQFGISRNLFALLLTAVAIAAFYFTWKIEKRVRKNNNFHTPKLWKTRYSFAAIIPFIIIAIVSYTPDHNQRVENRIAEAKRQQKCVFHEISADKMAYQIVEHHYELNIIDVRSPEKFNEFHIPLSINIPLEEIHDRKWERVFKQTIKKNIFYADNDTIVKMACLKAKHVGKSKNFILRESADEFNNMFFSPIAPDLAHSSKQLINEYNFRVKAAKDMQSLNEALKNIGQPVTKEIKVASGGC
ncbi:MAG: YeeE/YedE thiosulfate transporter family protein [Prolixibacteraceae bacterium]|jgi:rhodanese-related sulfurtransferase|nr:YeeE/YedE thiosulfate transporter family protein [Prolixibacteraceae bacterium]